MDEELYDRELPIIDGEGRRMQILKALRKQLRETIKNLAGRVLVENEFDHDFSPLIKFAQIPSGNMLDRFMP